MENINSLLFRAKKYLANNSIKSASIDSEILMCSVLKKDRDQLILNVSDKIDYEKKSIFNKLAERRKKSEPIAYIINKQEFWKDSFFVDNSVFRFVKKSTSEVSRSGLG